MCLRYTELLVAQVDADWKRTTNIEARDAIYVGWAREFFDKEGWIDQWFARGSHSDVPRALKTIARREFHSHGLNDYEPVLTVGPPDVFEKHESDLASYLFDGLDVAASDPAAQGFRAGPRLSLISVPYIEGTRALWHPLAVGHEIGHIRIEQDLATLSHLETGDWIDEFHAELADMLEAEREGRKSKDEGELGAGPLGGSPSPGIVRKAQATLQKWVNELLCDLNAVRLFGPGGLDAIAEFLAFPTPLGRPPADEPTPTHPRLSLRIEVMLHFLGAIGEGEAIPQGARWRRYVEDEKKRPLSDRAAYVEARVRDKENLARIVARAIDWGEVYLASRRETEIAWVTRELLDGIPGGTHCPEAPDTKGYLPGIKVADVVNAAWRARHALNEHEATRTASQSDGAQDGVQDGSGESEPLPALLGAGLPARDKRMRADRLATKAIDSIEFSLLWGLSGRSSEKLPRERKGQVQEGSGVLSKPLILDRLVAEGDDRLVVTPLLEDALQGAGIDLRLAPEFIAFRHSATAAFDPLDRVQDPRTLQEPVEKAWGDPFILHPGELVLAATLEYIVLPRDVAAQVVTRSSYGRLGLITATAVEVQPGSRGCITFELVNHGETPIKLTPGSRVAQLIFFKVLQPERAEPSKYQFPTGPEFSKVQLDPDAPVLDDVGAAARPEALRASARQVASKAPATGFTFSSTGTEAAHFATIAESEGVVASVTLAAIESQSLPERLAHVVGESRVESHIVQGHAGRATIARMCARLCLAVSRPVLLHIAGTDPAEAEDDTPVTATIQTADSWKKKVGLVVVSTPDGETAEVDVRRTDATRLVHSEMEKAAGRLQRIPLD